jgi:ABC-2 type transport system ATP-binding protein
VQDVCDRIAILSEGELQAYGEVKTLLQDTKHVQMLASNVAVSEDLRRDLKAVIEKHGGTLDSVDYPTTTLEEYFLRIVEESKAHPGRRYVPGADDKPAAPAAPAAPAQPAASDAVRPS